MAEANHRLQQILDQAQTRLPASCSPRCLHDLATRPARGTVSMLVITGGLVHSVSAARGGGHLS
jgi:hypothetical protein